MDRQTKIAAAKAEYRAAIRALDEAAAALNQSGKVASADLLVAETERVARAKAAYEAARSSD